jgi:hypothetical protein
VRLAICVFVCVCVWNSRGTAQSSRPEVQAHRLAEGESIVLDGVPDEAAWQKATPATDFRQRDPDNGAAATERTDVRVIFDKDRIVLGVTCFDSEPGELLGNQMQRDESFEADDRFMWAIDPFLDGRSGYFFEINPSGAMGDGLISGPGGGGGGGFGGETNKSWDGIWLARVRRTSLGWSAEIEIPFKTLNFDPDAPAWGANFQRTVRRKNEESLWTGWLRNEGLTKMSNAGRVGGIGDISQGIGLDLKPYVLGAAGNAPGRGRAQTDRDFDIGLDAFYNVTPALKANFTVNTDFAETEVDERRTNLTRFPLFFPEKREFFLDGANFFDFPTGEDSPFFSRRIGLNAGEAQPIAYGGKLIGQAGKYDVGVLQVGTSEADVTIGGAPALLKGEDFTVARAKRRFGSQSSLGVLYTRRAPRDSVVDPRQTIAADVTLATPNFFGDSVFDSGAWFIRTTKPDLLSEDGDPPPPGGSNAYGFDASLEKDPWDAGIRFHEYQAAYDAAVGFTPRRNYRSWSPEVSWSPRLSGHPVIRGFRFDLEMDLNLNLDNALVDRNVQVTPISIELHSGDSIQFDIFNQTEQLDEDFEISDGVILPVGNRFRWMRYQVEADTAEQRKVSGRLEYSFGGFWNGSRRELNLALTVRPRPGVSVQIDTEHNDVDLPVGSFTTRLYRVDARTQFNPWISLSNNVQYDSESGEVGWQVRFRWIQKPGNDLFFIWTQNWRDEINAGFRPLDRRGAAKIVRTIRF